jgi:hypothetical protein
MISAVGQMLGAVGSLFRSSILPLKSAIKTRRAQRAAMNVLTSHWSDLNRSLVENPDFAALWLRARYNRSMSWTARRSLGLARIWGVSCDLPIVSISPS